jgi:hypothetical protein
VYRWNKKKGDSAKKSEFRALPKINKKILRKTKMGSPSIRIASAEFAV